MKIKQASLSLLAGVLLLSGCNTKDIPDNIHSDISGNFEISDPMQESSDGQQGQQIPSLSYGVYFTEENVSISNDKLIVSPKLMGDDSSTRVGIMVFVDGILQTYSTENSPEKNIMSIFDIEPKSEITHDLIIDAEIDGDINEHIVSVITMLAPEYVPTSDKPQFGFYHRILRPFSVKAPNEINKITSANNYNVLKAENSVLTQKQIDYFDLSDGDGYATGFELLQSDNLYENYYTINDGADILSLKFYSYTTAPVVQDYRITFFVNHRPVKFNGNYDFLDIKLEGSKITEMDIQLKNIKSGDFVYCAAVPLIEGAHTEKSSSKMVLRQNDNSDTESDPNSAENNNSSSGAAESDPNSSENNNSFVAAPGSDIRVSGELSPAFSIGDAVYARKYENSELLKLNSSGELIKALTNGYNATVHGDKIATVEKNIYIRDPNGALMPAEKPNVTLKLMDMDFNVIKSLEITDNIGSKYDFDENHIIYICSNADNSKELRVCDWNLENEKVLMKLPSLDSNEARFFDEIALAEGYVAFTAQGEIGSKSVEYYGVCDFQGNHKLVRKDGISKEIQVIGDTALWYDKHVNVVGGKIPSGEVVIYRNGKFEVIKPENPIESQDVFLTDENEFFTALSDGAVLRQYKNGAKVAEIPLENGEYIISVAHAGNKVFAGTKTGSEYKLRIWELS